MLKKSTKLLRKKKIMNEPKKIELCKFMPSNILNAFINNK